MSDPLLPASVPLNLAAILLGRSIKACRELISAGSLPTVRVGLRREIEVEAIEQKLGFDVSPEMYLYAERQLDRSRWYDRERTAA